MAQPEMEKATLKKPGFRQIGMLDRIGNTALVLIVIVIIMVRTDIEEAITFQMYILMNFEIKAYRFHVLGF